MRDNLADRAARDNGAPMPPPEAYAHEFQARTSREARRTPTFISAAAFDGLPVPPRHWHVSDLIPSGTVTLLGGDGGVGKSLLALQLAACTALGRPWLGRPVAGGGALFVSAEDDMAELHRRLDTIARAEGVGLADVDRLAICSLAGEDALLATLDKWGVLRQTPLFAELDRQIAEDGPAIVVLDTLADMFPGNENDRAQARHFIGFLRGLAIRHGCAVLVLAHPSVAGMASGTGTSGSTAWSNSVRARLFLERIMSDGIETDPYARVLSTKKANYAVIGAKIAVRWQAGVFVADPASTGLDRRAALAKAERVFLAVLRKFAEQGRRVNPAGGPNYAPRLFAEHPDAEGMTKRALKDAMEALLASGKVRIEHVGPPSRCVSHLVEAAQ